MNLGAIPLFGWTLLLAAAAVFLIALSWRLNTLGSVRWMYGTSVVLLLLLALSAMNANGNGAFKLGSAFYLWCASSVVIGTIIGRWWRVTFLRERQQIRESVGMPQPVGPPTIVALPGNSTDASTRLVELVFDNPRLWVAWVHSKQLPIWLPLDRMLGVIPCAEERADPDTHQVRGQNQGTTGPTIRWAAELSLDLGPAGPHRVVLGEYPTRTEAVDLCNLITQWAHAAAAQRDTAVATYGLIHDADSLLDIVVRTIDDFALELRREPSALDALWNHTRQGWSPKREYALSNALDRHLRRVLQPRGINTAREVELWPPFGDGSGRRVDLFVQGVTPGVNQKQFQTATVVVEVKLDDHADVHTAMQHQLRDRYLGAAQRANHGVYVVGFYPCAQYKPDRAGLFDQLVKNLSTQAQSLSSASTRIKAVVLDLRVKPM